MNEVKKVYRVDFDLDGTAMVCLIRADSKTRKHVLKIVSISQAKPGDIIDLAVGPDAQVEIENAGAGEQATDA